VVRFSATVLAALALAATATAAGSTTKPVRAGHVSLRLPASWQVRRNVGPLLFVAIAPAAAGGKRTNVTVAEGPRNPRETLRTWRQKLVRGLSALPDGLRVRTRFVRLPGGRAVEVTATGGAGLTPQALMYGIQTDERAVVLVFTSSASAWRQRAPQLRAIARTLRIYA